MKNNKWSWRLFTESVAMSIAFVLVISILFYWTKDSLATFLAVAFSMLWAFFMYSKNVATVTDYYAVSFLLGNWIGAIFASLLFLSLIL